jgi:hypothetical protein
MRSAFALCMAVATAASCISVSSCSSWTESNLDGPIPPPPRVIQDASARPVSFAKDIRPLMNRSNSDPSGHGCKVCHYPLFWGDKGTDSTNLDLTTLGTLRKGGFHTPNIVVPGDPKNSAIVQKLRGSFIIGARMPKDGPPYWSESEIQLVERWIQEGAQGADNE